MTVLSLAGANQGVVGQYNVPVLRGCSRPTPLELLATWPARSTRGSAFGRTA